jgi:hypothetical protein
MAERILPPQQVRGIVGIGCDDVDATGEFEDGGRDHDRCPEGDVGDDGCDIARTAPAPI